MPEAIVIGSGPNGLVAANLLADQGWSVTVLEAATQPGGAVRSAEVMEAGFVNDHCSAFYPLGAASPVMRQLELEKWGLVWKHSPLVLAHPALDGSCPVISRNLDETVASLNELAPGDGDTWARLYGLWERRGEDLLQALFTPFPPVKAGARLARAMAPKDLLRLARFGVLPVRNFDNEYFDSPASTRLIAGLALHADLMPESPLSGFFGWFLACMAQEVGFPAPEGGASGLTNALVSRLEANGGTVQCNSPVIAIRITEGKASGVQLADGSTLAATRAVLADVNAVTLFKELVPQDVVPSDVKRDLDRFTWDNSTVKVDWNLDSPVPWSAEGARKAGTVHLTQSTDELTHTSSELARGLVPTNPFLLFGQQSMTDSTRAPAGKETAWAYTHVPIKVRGDGAEKGLDGNWNEEQSAKFVERMEDVVEAHAPGFKDLVRKRNVMMPGDLEADNNNLYRGAINGGTSALHQQLVFRPIPGLGRSETPIPQLFLASASAHPGGGVHGACGSNAARAAIASWKHRHIYTAVRWVATRHQGSPSEFP